MEFKLLSAGECVRAATLGTFKCGMQLPGNTNFISNLGATLIPLHFSPVRLVWRDFAVAIANDTPAGSGETRIRGTRSCWFSG
jgi:hypothetical protein